MRRWGTVWCGLGLNLYFLSWNAFFPSLWVRRMLQGSVNNQPQKDGRDESQKSLPKESCELCLRPLPSSDFISLKMLTTGSALSAPQQGQRHMCPAWKLVNSRSQPPGSRGVSAGSKHITASLIQCSPPNFLYTLFTIYSNSVILNKNSVSYARMIDYRAVTRSPPRDRLGAGGAGWLTQLTLYPHCMNVTSNPVIYCLEGSVQFFLPDQIAHFLEKEAKIFQHMDYLNPSFSPPGSMHVCRRCGWSKSPFLLLLPRFC